MQNDIEEKQTEELVDALKGAAVALAIVATIPIFIPTAACVLAFTEIKEALKRCSVCGSRKLQFKGKESHKGGGCMDIRFDRGTPKRRKSPVYSYFECADCSSRFKKFYGSPLETATEQEFSEMLANSF
ncbi:MAG TPA: hypothetical protein V6C89_16850 [Drouetiella sp.]|jgi:hypothetical protein